jgi:hypothetical protein
LRNTLCLRRSRRERTRSELKWYQLQWFTDDQRVTVIRRKRSRCSTNQVSEVREDEDEDERGMCRMKREKEKGKWGRGSNTRRGRICPVSACTNQTPRRKKKYRLAPLAVRSQLANLRRHAYRAYVLRTPYLLYW